VAPANPKNRLLRAIWLLSVPSVLCIVDVIFLSIYIKTQRDAGKTGGFLVLIDPWFFSSLLFWALAVAMAVAATICLFVLLTRHDALSRLKWSGSIAVACAWVGIAVAKILLNRAAL
jgi:hypothetical protein